MFSYLHSLMPILPRKVIEQAKLVNLVVDYHARYEELTGGECDKRRLHRFALSEKQISRRYIECPDSGTDWNSNFIYKMTKHSLLGADINERNEFFSMRALEVMEEAYQGQTPPDHLIHVTCTGYVAPSAPQLYFSNKTKAPAITHAYHMGCYASLPTIRLASSLALSENHKVDIIHNEMCSLHSDPSRHIPEQIVVETLFADGHIHYQVSQEKKGFRILGIKEKIISDTSDKMSWIPGPYGMNMTLSREVPQKIRDNILPFLAEMAQEQKIDLAPLLKQGIFAIHPGGPQIIEVVKKKLELRDDQIKESKKVLFERGNMSSATLPHVWFEMMKNQYPEGTLIVSLAFGPGLTVFGSLFEVV